MSNKRKEVKVWLNRSTINTASVDLMYLEETQLISIWQRGGTCSLKKRKSNLNCRKTSLSCMFPRMVLKWCQIVASKHKKSVGCVKIRLTYKGPLLFYLFFFYLHYHTLGTNDTITYKVSSSDSFYRFQANERGGGKKQTHICKIQYILSLYSLCR